MGRGLVLGVVTAVAGLLLLYLALVGLLWRAHRRSPETTIELKQALRLLPDLLRLFKNLAADRTLPRGVRVRLVLLIAYLASPIDLIPDFVPVLGYADDAVIVAIVLRSTVRRAGLPAVERHWSGSPQGFALLTRLTGLS